MDNFYLKFNGKTYDAWIEDSESVKCEASCFINGDECLIDTIETREKFKGQGYATALVNELKKRFDKVQPIGIIPSAKPFWDKLGMEDGLGEEW